MDRTIRLDGIMHYHVYETHLTLCYGTGNCESKVYTSKQSKMRFLHHKMYFIHSLKYLIYKILSQHTIYHNDSIFRWFPEPRSGWFEQRMHSEDAFACSITLDHKSAS